MAGERVYNALKVGLAEHSKGATRAYAVIPQYADTYQDILRRAYLDARYQTHGLTNETAVSFGHPNILNSQRWNYRQVYQGPFTQDDQLGHVALDGRDTLHFHLSDPGEGVGHASDIDLEKFQQRLRQTGLEDSTMAVADRYGNIHVYGSRESLARRGFQDQDMVREYRSKLENNDTVSRYKDGDNPQMDVPMYGVVLPSRINR